MHQPLGGARASKILKFKPSRSCAESVLLGIMAKHTGQPLEVIERDSDRDYYLEAKGAVDYGLVDQVLEMPEKVK
jgi:ATP-dependent Clp protease protease subunit